MDERSSFGVLLDEEAGLGGAVGGYSGGGVPAFNAGRHFPGNKSRKMPRNNKTVYFSVLVPQLLMNIFSAPAEFPGAI